MKYLLLIIALLCLTSCTMTKVFDGMFKRNEYKEQYIQKPIPAIDLSKEKLVINGYSQLNKGISAIVLSFLLGIMFANPILNRFMNIGLGVGTYLIVSGLMKIFIAQYLLWFCWGAGILFLFIILYRWRHSSILKSKDWCKAQFKKDKPLWFKKLNEAK